MSNILLVEGDASVHKIIRYELSNKGYQVDSLYHGRDAVSKILEGNYALVLLDWVLSHKSGLSIIKEVRATGYHKPMILLTNRSEEKDIIKGLMNGADDYLLKPFQPSILMARIEAHLRRFHNHFLQTLQFLDVKMNLTKHEVLVNQKQVSLTKVEYNLLKLFLEKPGQVLSREEIILKIWNFAYDGHTRLADIHLFKLKKKLEDSQVDFKSVRGVGYKLIEIKDETFG